MTLQNKSKGSGLPKRCVAPLLAVVLLVGCATGYQDAKNPILGITGGYQEEKGPGELIKVSFSGSAYTPREKVGVYLLYRCAEIAQRENKPYFAMYSTLPAAVMDKRSTERVTGTFIGKATSYAYILFFNGPAPGLLSTKEVLARLEPEVKGGVKP